MDFVPEIEFRPVDEIRRYQEQRLHEHLVYLQAHSPFYQRMFAENDIDINTIRTLDSLLFGTIYL